MTKLTPEGQEIYEEINAFLQSVGLDSVIDRIELSRLANAIDLNQRASESINKLNFDNSEKSYAQSSTYVTWKETNNIIKELSDKYGLTPRGRKALGLNQAKEDESPLSKFI